MSKQQVKPKKKKLGSYPYASVIFSIFLALFVIGLFALLLVHTNKLGQLIRENIEIEVYLNKDITDNQRIQIQKTLSGKPYAAKKNEEVQIRYVSREDAAKIFIEETGEDYSEFLGTNPLRDAYSVKVSAAYQEADSMQMIREEIEAMSGVFEVDYVESLVESINKNVKLIGAWLLGIAILLLLAVVLLINNTIKLALFSQRFLIRSMQLVGAKNSFIQGPFLWRSTLHGLIAGIIASGVLYGILKLVNREMSEFDLASLQNPEMLIGVFGILLILGAVIGFFSTWRAIKKYLRLSLDELY